MAAIGAGGQVVAQAAVAAHVHAGVAAGGGGGAMANVKTCRTCGLAKPRPRPLKLLGESWHGLECPYCYGRRYIAQGDVKQNSLTRRIQMETWIAAKLLRKKCKKPKGKILTTKLHLLRDNPLACVAFAGQLLRTHAAAIDAGLANVADPLKRLLPELGL